MVVSQPGSVAWTGGRAGPNNSPPPKTAPPLHSPPSPVGHCSNRGSLGLKGQRGLEDGGQEGVAPR